MKIIEVTLLFLGSVIGAGFATGAEIITFFGHLRLPIWCIALITGITMFAIIALEIFIYYPRNKQATTQNSKKPNLTSKFSDIITLLIYFILFTAMTAGVTSVTNPYVAVISLIVSTFIVFFGFNKLSRINSWLVFVIIFLIITTAIPHLLNYNILQVSQWAHLPNGIFWGFLYAGLNCFMFPELIKAAAKQKKRKTLFWAGGLTAFLIMILVGLILTIIKNCQVTSATIPLLAAAPTPITMIIILLAILTSQYTALFAIMERSSKLFPAMKNRPLTKAIGICLCTLFTSFLGFSQIINFAYPLIGIFTCFFLLISWLKSLQA